MAEGLNRVPPVVADHRGATERLRPWRPSTNLLSLLMACLILGFLGADLWRTYHQTEDQAFHETMGLERVYESHVVSDVRAVDDMLSTFANRVKELDAANPSGLRGGPAGYNTRLLARIEADGRMLLQSLPAGELALVDNRGQIIASTLLPRGYALGVQDYMVSALASSRPGKSNFGAATRGPIGNALQVPFARPIYRDDGSIIGIAVTRLDPARFVEPFQSVKSFRYNAVTIVQRDGLVIARAPAGQDLIGKSIAAGDLFRKHLATESEGSARIAGSIAGKDLLVSYKRIGTMPFIVISAFDADEEFKPWYRMATSYALLGVIAIFAILWCGRLLARDQLRRQTVATANRIRTIIDGMAGFVILFSADGHILEINQGALERGLLDRDDVVGRPLWKTRWFSYSSAMQEKTRWLIGRAASGEKIRDDLTVRIGPDTYRTLDITLQSIEQSDGNRYLVGSAFDVTDQRQLEAKLRNAQKMEALGLLAGGISHDFNNLLASMSSYAEFLTEDLEPSSPQFGFADRLRVACDQGKEMVAQILTYARPNEVERRPIDLVAVVREVRDLFESTCPQSITMEWNVPWSEESNVVANRAQMTQILLNLCVNAVDAIDPTARNKINRRTKPAASDDDGDHQGIIALRLDTADFDDPELRRQPSGTAGSIALYQSAAPLAGQRYVRLIVRDSGAGMSQDVLQRIFDPFFTTKSRGKGTGLGLAVVHSIVSSLGGLVVVESTPGAGSEFAIYLPLSNATAGQAVSA